MTTGLQPRGPRRTPARRPPTARESLALVYVIVIAGSVLFTGRLDFLWHRGNDGLAVGLYWLSLQILVAHAAVAWASRLAAGAARRRGAPAPWPVPSPLAAPWPLLYLPAIVTTTGLLIVHGDPLGTSTLVDISGGTLYCLAERAAARGR